MLIDALKLEQEWEPCWAGLGTTSPFGQHQWGWGAWAAWCSLMVGLVDCGEVLLLMRAQEEERQQRNPERLRFVPGSIYNLAISPNSNVLSL